MEDNDKFIGQPTPRLWSAGKYRIESTRLPGYNYSANGYYFITICTKYRIEYFGDVLRDDGGAASVALTPIGKIARDCWLDIVNHFPNVSLDEWVIMPNHVHGIVVINQNNNQCNDYCRDEALPRLYKGKHAQMSKISPKPQSLPVIIGSYKSAVTYKCHKQNLDFQWQTRYYDRIIRNKSALYAVRYYIQTNPDKWYRDRNNPDNLWM